MKYLGILLDDELQFQEHTTQALAKGTQWALQVACLSRPKVGMPAHHMQQLYNTVIVPKMLYGMEIFCARRLES